MAKRVLQDSEPVHLSVIMPALNEGEVIADLVRRVKSVLDARDEKYEILVVDDGSSDNTASEARSMGAHVIQHPYNIGNGAAIKTGIRHAKGSVLIMIDGDGQEDPNDIPRLLEKIGVYDMIVGSRTRASETALHRDLANTLYNWLASYISGRKIEDLTCGLRAVKTRIARQFVYLLPNAFSYPSTLTLSIVRAGYSLGYIPIRTTRRAGKNKSKIKPLQDGLRFLLIILKIAVFYSPLKVFMPLSVLIFLLGIAYGFIRVLAWHLSYGQTSALLVSTATLVFLVGLVSEQIALLRFDRSESSMADIKEEDDF